MTIAEARGTRTRTAAANRAQTDIKNWNKWESGKVIPGHPIKKRIARALHVDVQELWPDIYKVPVGKATTYTHAIRPSGRPFCYSTAKLKDVAPGTWDKVTCMLCHDKSGFDGEEYI